MTNIKDADDAPLSQGERVSDARIISRQSERIMETETSQSLSDEDHTVIFPLLNGAPRRTPAFNRSATEQALRPSAADQAAAQKPAQQRRKLLPRLV